MFCFLKVIKKLCVFYLRIYSVCRYPQITYQSLQGLFAFFPYLVFFVIPQTARVLPTCPFMFHFSKITVFSKSLLYLFSHWGELVSCALCSCYPDAPTDASAKLVYFIFCRVKPGKYFSFPFSCLFYLLRGIFKSFINLEFIWLYLDQNRILILIELNFEEIKKGDFWFTLFPVSKDFSAFWM